jgi:hypothetical protein
MSTYYHLTPHARPTVTGKSLLVRADFVLGGHEAADPLVFRRWRRILFQALPRLLGCADRCPEAEDVCLHKGSPAGRYTAWLRIPTRRRPNRRFVARLGRKLWSRLDDGLRPLGGRVLKLGVRRYRAPILPFLAPAETAPGETAPPEIAPAETVQSHVA